MFRRRRRRRRRLRHAPSCSASAGPTARPTPWSTTLARLLSCAAKYGRREESRAFGIAGSERFWMSRRDAMPLMFLAGSPWHSCPPFLSLSLSRARNRPSILSAHRAISRHTQNTTTTRPSPCEQRRQWPQQRRIRVTEKMLRRHRRRATPTPALPLLPLPTRTPLPQRPPPTPWLSIRTAPRGLPHITRCTRA